MTIDHSVSKAWDTMILTVQLCGQRKKEKTWWAFVKSHVRGRHSHHPGSRLIVPVSQRRELMLWQGKSRAQSHTPHKKWGWNSNTSMSNSQVPMCKFRTNPWCQNILFLFIYLNVNYSKNKFPVILISKIWFQEKYKAL